MPAPLGSPIFQWFTPVGEPAAGYKVYSYVSGSSTPLATYPTSADATAGTSALANPVILDAAGRAQIWLADVLYKIVIKTALDIVDYTIDAVSGAGGSGGGTSSASSQWASFSGTPTYLSATSFSVSGDQRSTFTVGRRTKSTVTAGTAYSQVSASTFASSITTVTLINTSGVLDSGLSSVSVGIITPDNTAAPAFSNVLAAITSQSVSAPGGVTALPFATPILDALSEISGANFTAKVAGYYFVSGSVCFEPNASVSAISGNLLQVGMLKNSAGTLQTQMSWPFGNSLDRLFTVPLSAAFSLVAGDVLTLSLSLSFTGGAVSVSTPGGAAISIRRVA